MGLKPFTGELDAPSSGGLTPFMGELDPVEERASIGDVVAGTPLARFAMGAASPLIGAAQLGAHVGDLANKAMGVEPVVSPWIDKHIAAFEAAKQRGMKASGTEGVDVMGLLGSVAPSAALAKGVSAVLPQATTMLQRAGTSALQGGAAAVAQPVTNTDEGFWSPKGIQAGVGAVTGGVLPLVEGAGKAIGKMVQQAAQPFTDKGRAAILRELQNAVLGNDPHLRKIAIDALKQAKPGVGGVTPTAGEVLASINDPEMAARFTGLMAHQKNIAKLPGISPEFQARAAAQAGAREAEIGTIAQTPQALEQAIGTRGTTAAQQYGQALQQTVQPDAAFASLLERPSMQKAMGRATELAKEAGETFDPTSVKSLHYMKMAMDDLLKNPERFSIGATEAGAIGKTQKEFVKWIGEHAPDYDAARQAFHTASGPINRMQVGQELQQALTTPLGTSERGIMFAKAAQDAPRTIKRATGQQMFDSLNDILTPKELASVERVGKELSTADALKRLASQTSLSGKDAIPGQVGLPLPNLLYRPSMIANFLLRHAGQGAEEKISKLAAGQYLQPNQLAAALEDIPPRYAPMMNAMRQRLPGVVGAAMGRAVQP